MDENLILWKKAVDFHGHVCGGLTIGYKASLYAIKLLDLNFSEDEEVVCVTENDACGVDAIQAILGCSVGKGNLIFRIRGKQAFSFFNRTTGKSVRLILKDLDYDVNLSKEEKQKIMFDTPEENLFDIKEVGFELPEKARIFQSVKCDCCGEKTAEHLIRLENGKKLCLDCFNHYERFM